MVMPNLPQAFGLEIIMITEIGYLWFKSKRNRKTETLSAFSRLCFALLLFLLINIPVRVSDLHLARWKQDIVFILNALFIGLETLTAYEWFIYFLTIQGAFSKENRKRIRILSALPLVLMAVLLGVSYWTGWLFYVDDTGIYKRGSLFFLQLLIPYCYLAASFVSAVLAYRKDQNKRLFAVFSSAFFASVVASILQVLYSGSFALAGLSLAVLLIYMEMYQYEIRQIDKMKSLSIVNEKLESANEKLCETIHELEVSVANEKAANNAKNDFLSRMSHDIRTPLNGILGIIEINERHPEDTNLVSANRKKAKSAASHLLSLINDVLDMSKLSSGKYELAKVPFNMLQLVNELQAINSAAADAEGITLIIENDNDSFDYPTTLGSPLHITRILLNVVGNAIKYNNPGGSVQIRLDHEFIEESKIRYIVTVSDTGIGMSEEYIKTLFEPFSQERIDARSVYSGTGLGMAITKALVDKMNGTIDIESTVGKGSTFTISLPFETAPKVISETERAEEENLQGIHILLAEDNELNIDIAKTLLEDFGAEVDVAENGSIAIEKFIQAQEGEYDVILMDCMMPVLNGYEATQAIRGLGRADSAIIPIIAMTANAFDDDVRKCLESGMNDHLSKPFETVKVIKTIRKYVPGHRVSP